MKEHVSLYASDRTIPNDHVRTLHERLAERRLLDRAVHDTIRIPLSVIGHETNYLFSLLFEDPIQQKVMSLRNEGVSANAIRTELGLSRRKATAHFTSGMEKLNKFFAEHGIEKASNHGRALKDAIIDDRLPAILLFNTYYADRRDIDTYKPRMRDSDMSELPEGTKPLAELTDPSGLEYHRLIRAKAAWKDGSRWISTQDAIQSYYDNLDQTTIPDSYCALADVPLSRKQRNRVSQLERSKKITLLRKNGKVFVERAVIEDLTRVTEDINSLS